MYEYVGSNPVRHIDPEGTAAFTTAAVIAFIVGAIVIDDVAESPTVHTTSEEMAENKRANDQKNAAVLGAVILSPFELADAIENVWDVLSDPFGTLSDPLFPLACTPFLTAKGRKLLRKQDVSNGAGQAHDASNAVKLNKSLASQEQVGQVGSRIAGEGTGVPFRNADRIAQQHGGEASDWVKMRSASHVAPDGTRFETHWVENTQTGKRVEFKTKMTGGGQ